MIVDCRLEVFQSSINNRQSTIQEPLPVIYGMVTTGRIWELGKLENKVVTIHPFNLSLTQLNLLLGVLDYLFVECEAQLEKSRLAKNWLKPLLMQIVIKVIPNHIEYWEVKRNGKAKVNW